MTAYLLVSDDIGIRSSLGYVQQLLEHSGIELVDLEVDDSRIPVRDRDGRQLEKEFTHTPEPLRRSRRMARNLEDATRPSDIILASDKSGLGGVFALMQASARPEERRRLWTLVSDSAYLELRLVARAHVGLPMPLESVVDWEITQYRFSDRVLATSEMAIVELQRLGVDAELIGSADGSAGSSIAEPPFQWWVPGPVSRRNQVGEILRALTSITGATATLSNRDMPDLMWTGSTWDALVHPREVLGDRVRRGDRPNGKPDVVIVGDPYSPPDRATRDMRHEGIPVVVPAGSVCSVLWPDAPQWSEADDLVAIMGGRPYKPGPVHPTLPDTNQTPQLSPASRVSVGVPVFRDVRFLNECVESILAQELEPTEIIIVDDGSCSDAVDQALNAWVERDDRIRVIRAEHRGVCVARNRALEEMTGDCFLFVDSDDVLETTFLSKCANMLRANDSLWAVATWTRFFGAYEGVEAKPPFDARVGLRENPIISTGALVDMHVREAGIRFEPDLAFLYCEDWHFWSQIVAAGGRIGLVPEALANHRVHQASGGYLRTESGHAVGKTRATEPLIR